MSENKEFMKKVLYLSLMAIFFSSILSGCVRIDIEKDPPKKEEVIQEHAITEQTITEGGETEDIMDQFDYYCYSRGSSSVSESYMIYIYDEKVIFVADYFNCGDGLAKTYVLSDEQVSILKSQLEQGLSDAQQDDKTAPSAAEEVPADGGSSTSASICLNGEIQKAKVLDLSALEIELQDASDIEFPDDTNDSYDIENFAELPKSDVWRGSPFFIGAYEYERMIGEQVEKIIGQKPDTMTIGEMGVQDYELKVTAKDGEEHRLNVTYWGYVIEPSQA